MTQREIKLLAKEIVAEQMRYEVIGIDEAAKILGVKPQTVRNKLSEIPHCKFGKATRFFKGDLIKMIQR